MCKHWTGLYLIVLVGTCAATSKVFANIAINVVQVGPNVVLTGSGTVNTTALSLRGTGAATAEVVPTAGILVAGPATTTTYDVFSGPAGPTNFGTGVYYPANTGSGDAVGIVSQGLIVPIGYTSGATLSDTDVYSGVSLANLGLTPGTYVYSWGAGPTADSLTINIGTVPEPASLAMLGVPAAIALLRRRRGGCLRGK